jgi:hypothetical protein
MPNYIVHFKANPSGWPSDPSEILTMWEGVVAGANRLLEQGLFEGIYWVSNLEGYALTEAESKAAVITMITPFFPLFTQDVMELTPHPEAGEALLAGAKMAAESS